MLLYIILIMHALYTNNWRCYCISHVCIIFFLGPCGFHFVIPQLYNGKCYSLLYFTVHVLYITFLVQSFMYPLISPLLQFFLVILFVLYYVGIFMHMFCFLSESFEPTRWHQVLTKTQQRRRKKKDVLVV